MPHLSTRIDRLEATLQPAGMHSMADLWRLAAEGRELSAEEQARYLWDQAQAGVFADIDGYIATARGWAPPMRALLRFGLDGERADLQTAGILDDHGHLVAGITLSDIARAHTGEDTMTKTRTPTLQELDAQNNAAAAHLLAVSAQQRQRRAELDAAEATAQAERAAAQVERAAAQERLAGYRRQAEAAAATIAEQRRLDVAQDRARIAEYRQGIERAQAVIDEERTRPVDLSHLRAVLAQTDSILDATTGKEERARVREMDHYESRRLHDSAFRARFDASHPGGADGCTCLGHQAWREALADGSLVLRGRREA